jgi:hypothetical protein
MRQVIVNAFLTLDGVMQAPGKPEPSRRLPGPRRPGEPAALYLTS